MKTSLVHALVRSAAVYRRVFDEETEGRFTLPQALLLTALLDMSGCSQRDLCRETKIDRSSMGEMIPRLRQCGYLVTKKSGEDGRALVVTITHAGKQAALDAAKALKNTDRRVLAIAPTFTRTLLMEGLQKIAAHAEADPT